jgi:glycosyltransferase involved in cell wall biosynthesis
MTRVEGISGVPAHYCNEYQGKKSEYCVLIPIINEGTRIHRELKRAQDAHISGIADIIICDGGSKDGCTDENILRNLDVNTLLVKDDIGKQGAQLRMGIYFALERGYCGIITIDGNDKDSIEDVPRFIEKLNEGYDLVQGSRFVRGGNAINTPFSRMVAVKLIHAPIISLTAGFHFTDTTNAYRGYSAEYLKNPMVDVFRDVFMTYELLAYLSVRATQLGMKVCEIPVTRAYPKQGKTPTKISPFKGNMELIRILFANLRGKYTPGK